MIKKENRKIAYFSMEIALQNSIKTYAGGLGVLAGDTLRSAADLRVPMVGVTLLHDQGYFKQKINKQGKQEVLPAHYDFTPLKKKKEVVEITINQDPVKVTVWEYHIIGVSDYKVPIYLLDTKVSGNAPLYQSLTGQLYRGRDVYRLMQEMVLGRAGVRMLEALGYKKIVKFHMNEGHGGFVAVELYSRMKGKPELKVKKIRGKCIFTTHTPVPSGHDRFDVEMVKDYEPEFPFEVNGLTDNENKINMTRVGLAFSGFVNGVAMKHKEISEQMFPHYHIDTITNGVHSATWTSPIFQKMFDKYIPTWRKSSYSLRNAFKIPLDEIWEAHEDAKEELFKEVLGKTGEKMAVDVFTIGFARRFTGYKRANLLLFDIDRLARLNRNVGEMQILYAGKAHPSDDIGQKLISDIVKISKEYRDKLKIVFLEGYDLNLAKLLTAGVDVWLNTPLPPNEASGTSGMKAAHNGVPHFSTLDGWWLEGCIEDQTGWSIGEERPVDKIKELDKEDADDLYDKLENKILPRYYKDKRSWKDLMRNVIAINASFFNTHRMIQHYIQEAYFYHDGE